MSKVISVTNVKGGVGKSITALFLSRLLSDAKHRTLLIDLDSQNSLTSFFYDGNGDTQDKTIFEVLLGKRDIREAIKQIGGGLDFIPADISLSNLTLQLTENRDFRLYTALEHIRGDYDYIVIDTPPSLHIETKLALVVSNYIIIPTLLEKWASRSIEIVLSYIKNKNIPMQEIIKVITEKVFILPTMTEKNRKIQDIVLADIKEKYQTMVLNGISRKTDIQKLAYIGREVDITGLDAYGEYAEVVNKIKGGK